MADAQATIITMMSKAIWMMENNKEEEQTN
jgi:hypothetical protein